MKNWLRLSLKKNGLALRGMYSDRLCINVEVGKHYFTDRKILIFEDTGDLPLT